MDDHFVFAHISDLHFSSGASQRNPNHSHSIYELKGLEVSLKNKDLDLLILSGDITNYGDHDSLCRAYDWLFKKFTIGEGEDIGLEFEQKKLGVVPGNHDAWNSRSDSGDLKERRQKSLVNYNDVFINHRIDSKEPAYYDWLEKGDNGIYLVFLDSCFLGEQRDEKDNLIPYVDDIARGKLSIEQSELLLEWHDRGTDGSLENPRNQGEIIDKKKFAKSLKILVMHHYIFEPPNATNDYFMKLNHRDIVFKNVALSDFDILLCGHKHLASFDPHTYGHHMDPRASHRYLLNYFRRMLGIHSYPIQYVDEDGKRFPKSVTFLINVISKMIKKKEVAISNSQIDEMSNILLKGIDEPKTLEKEIKLFIQKHGLTGSEFLSNHEANEIQKRISVKLSVPERKKLKEVASNITKITKSLKSKTFLQIMAGSSAKAISHKDTERSFNIYKIKPIINGWELTSERYPWNYEEIKFEDEPIRHSHPFVRQF